MEVQIVNFTLGMRFVGLGQEESGVEGGLPRDDYKESGGVTEGGEITSVRFGICFSERRPWALMSSLSDLEDCEGL